MEPYELLHDCLLVGWPMIADLFGISVQSTKDRFERELRLEGIVFDSRLKCVKENPVALKSRLQLWAMRKAQLGEIL